MLLVLSAALVAQDERSGSKGAGIPAGPRDAASRSSGTRLSALPVVRERCIANVRCSPPDRRSRGEVGTKPRTTHPCDKRVDAAKAEASEATHGAGCRGHGERVRLIEHRHIRVGAPEARCGRVELTVHISADTKAVSERCRAPDGTCRAMVGMDSCEREEPGRWNEAQPRGSTPNALIAARYERAKGASESTGRPRKDKV